MLVVLASAATNGQLAPEPVKPPPTIDSAFFNSIRPRSLGPTTMGGRIMDLAVYGPEPRIFYIATATGGLWKTVNGGTTTTPVFFRERTVALGAAAVSQTNPDVVWVGTGEGCSRNSSGWGDGVYLSKDGGTTWTNVGLRDSRHISRIVIHPKNENIVFVGAVGHLWGPNEERGLFKTTDGGKTWQRCLYVNEWTGVADVAMNPKNPDHMLVAMWERYRLPWTFISGGKGSGLYQTTNGGKSWTRVTRGLPTGTLGRIGLSFFHQDPKLVVATVEAQGGGVFISKDGGSSWTKTSSLNPRPFYFSHPEFDPKDPNRIYLFAVSIHVSDDQGKTFRVMQINVHPDHHAAWINPSDNHHLIVGNDGGVVQSRDRGQTWEHINRMAIGQFYAVTYDMRKPYYVYGGLQDNGSWAGPTQTTRGGVSFYDFYGIGGGDGFHVQVDPNNWATVYSESQGGAIGRLNQLTGERRSIRPRPPQGERYRFNWSSPILISPHNSRIVYFGGNRLFRSVNEGDTWEVISPDLTTNNEDKQRPGVGSVTPENTGAETHCTIVTISESPMQLGLIWVGTDDGQVQLTRNGGATWTNVTANIPDLPDNTWCSRVVASKYALGRCYATFDGHRMDDYNPYVYVTEDFGQTWTRLAADLGSDESCYVIREGVLNPDLLVLGTETSLWISLDRGKTWARYQTSPWPTVPVHDLVIHPRELDLIVGTHGRSIWIIPFSGLEQLTQERLQQDAYICPPSNVYLLGRVTSSAWDGDALFVSPNTQPGTTIFYYLKTATNDDVQLSISDVLGNVLATATGAKAAGLHAWTWNARRTPGPNQGQGRAGSGGLVAPGEYRVTLKVGTKEYVTSVRVEDVSGQLHR